MLVRATREDIARYLDFAYAIALDQTRSGYPLFSDGVSTREQFAEHVWRGYGREDGDILLFVADGAVEGWIQFFYIARDRYLQTDGFLIGRDTDRAMSEFMEYAHAHFAGYDLYLGFPERNARAIAFLRQRGCRLSEEAYHDIFVFDGAAVGTASPGLVKVTEGNFPEFEELYRAEPDAYWSADRIRAALNEWTVYLLHRDGIAAGYVCARDGEIFSLGYREHRFDRDVYGALVTAVLRDLKAAGYGHMTFFNDEESQSAALELGFSCVGKYVLYVGRA